MKTRLKNNSEVAHFWANQTQAEGRGSAFYFRGPIIYSYGAHFPIARFVGAETVFFTVKGYSVTTSRHVSLARSALAYGVRVYEVEDVLADDQLAHILNAKALRAEIEARQGEALRSRKHFESLKERTEAAARGFVGYVQDYLVVPEDLTKGDVAKLQGEMMEIKALLDSRTFFSPETLEKKKESLRAEREAARVKREAEDAETQVKLDQWAAGGPYLYAFSRLPIALRIKDGKMETSHGADVPLDAARELFRYWQMIRATGEAATVGQKVGAYTVNAIAPDDMTVGCHKINYAAVARVLEEVSV